MRICKGLKLRVMETRTRAGWRRVTGAVGGFIRNRYGYGFWVARALNRFSSTPTETLQNSRL